MIQTEKTLLNDSNPEDSRSYKQVLHDLVSTMIEENKETPYLTYEAPPALSRLLEESEDI